MDPGYTGFAGARPLCARFIKSLTLALAALALVSALCERAWPESQKAEQMERVEQLRNNVAELFRSGNYKQAIPLLKDILAINPRDKSAARHLQFAEQQGVEPYCKQADEFFQTRAYEKAISEWEKVLLVDPEDPRAGKLIEMTRNLMQDNVVESMHALVGQFLLEGDYSSAVNELEKILLIRPDDARARELLISSKQAVTNTSIKEYYEKAEALLKEGKFDQAIELWKGVLDIDPKQEGASRNIALAKRKKLNSMYADAKKLYRDGNYAASREMYFKLMTENPTDQDVKDTIKRLNDTINVVQKIDAKGPAWDMLRKALANHIDVDGNRKAAIAAAWYAEQLDANNELTFAVRSFIEREHLVDARSMEPPVRDMNIIDQYLFAALNHIYEGRYDLAIQESSIVVDLQPENILALKRLGSAYYAMGKKDKAKEAWEKALGLSPDDKELVLFIKQVK